MDLTQIYSNPESQQQRYAALKAELESQGYAFVRYARAPGRVNLISEHTDYNGYQVSPIAIENDFVFAIGTKAGSGIVTIQHMDPSEHPTDSFDSRESAASIAHPNNEWSQYVRAGFHAAKTYNENLSYEFDLLLVGSGTVPLGSGLSSSSALTCCSALAFLAFEKEVDKVKLAQMVAKSEATVAIEGGGMDQAISLNAELGKVAVIKFNPLSLSFVKLPEGIRVAVFSSMKDSKKATGDSNFYNTRVAECRAGCALLYQKYTKQEFASNVKINMCADIQTLYGKKSPSQMLSESEELPEKLSLKQLAEQLHYKSVDELMNSLFTTQAGGILLKNYTDKTQLTIQKRLNHVYSEAFRAQMFERVLSNISDDDHERLHQLSAISNFMKESHVSCKDDYECSCQELEEVIRAATNSGAFCARLTGAGMGGFAVGLIHAQDDEEFMAKMTAFYKSKGVKNIEDVLFLTDAGIGGGYL
ncbi:Galactokinase [Hexamita inflata]|uniref:Galactokinase n=1 Tax=Hexamita inflata TaxID=28002 RepID=A0AA86P076_9EUKA|nr:Galactokinase [Hexamita inflata]